MRHLSGLLALCVMLVPGVLSAQLPAVGSGYGSGAMGDMVTVAEGMFDEPHDVAIDAEGNLFVADRELHKVFKVDINGNVTEYAGNGSSNHTGDGGPATEAALWEPHRLVVDPDGNLLIADSRNGYIRHVDAATGTISSVAGADFFSATSSFDDGVAATDRILFLIRGLFVEQSGDFWVDEGFYISEVTAADGIIRLVAGDGDSRFNADGNDAKQRGLDFPEDIFVMGSNLYIAERQADRIRKVDLNTGIITTVAGNGSRGYSGDGGLATEAELDAPYDVHVMNDGTLLIADQGNDVIRKVDGVTGIITTVAGAGPDAGTDGDGVATEMKLDGPRSVIADAEGNLYVAEINSSRIRKIFLGLDNTQVVSDGGSGGSTGGSSGGSSSGSETPATTLGTLVLDQMASGSINGGAEVYALNIEARSEVVLTLNTGFDAVLLLYSGDNAADTTVSNQIAYADSRFFGDEIITTVLDPGTYIVSARPFSDDTGDYTLMATATPTGVVSSSLPSLVLGETVSGSINGDSEVYGLTIGSEADVTIVLDTDFDAVVDLYVGDTSEDLVAGNHLASADGFFSGEETIEMTLAPGNYLVVARSYGSETGAYTLVATSSGAPVFTELEVLNFGQPVSGTVTDPQLFGLAVDEASQVELVLVTDFDVVLGVFAGTSAADTTEANLLVRIDGVVTGEERVLFDFDPGAYVVVASSFAGDTGAFTLSAAQGEPSVSTRINEIHSGPIDGLVRTVNFNLSESTPIFLTLNADIDVVMRVYIEGSLFLTLDEAVSGPETFTNNLPAASYTVEIEAFDSGQSGGNYELVITSDGQLPVLTPGVDSEGSVGHTEDEIYLFTLEEETDVTLTAETTFDGVLWLYSGDELSDYVEGNLIQRVDATSGATETYTGTLDAGSYLAAVSGYSRGVDTGNYTLNLTGPAVVSSAPTPDFDGDGSVGFPDFLSLASVFGSSAGDPSFDARFDLDQDGSIGFGDFLQFASVFGTAVKPAVSKSLSKQALGPLPDLTLSTTQGEDGTLSVTLGREDGVSTIGYGLDLQFDPMVLELVGASSAEPSLLGDRVAILVADEPGVARVGDVFASTSEGSELATIQFKVLDPTALSRVEILDAFVSDGTRIGRLFGPLSADLRAIPTDYGLERNFPNPFNPETTIAYQLPEAGVVSLKIYNSVGQEVRTLAQGPQDAGFYRVRWDGRDARGRSVASGTYLYQLTAEGYRETQRMMLMK